MGQLFGLPKGSLSSGFPPINEVYVTGGNGYGSAATKIRLFLNIITAVGTAITYVPSATEGSKFIINEDGYYAMTYRDYGTATGVAAAISLNSAQLTTNWNTISNASRLAAFYSGAVNQIGNTSVVRYLKAGDIIRAHGDGSGNAPGDDVVGFSIVKVA